MNGKKTFSFLHQGRTIHLPSLFVELLQARGVVEEQVSGFLFPRLADLPHPNLMHNLPAAAKQVAAAMRMEKQIVVWGDYDVDGTSATALLINFFREYGIEVLWHIPNRLSEGYGLHSQWFRNGGDGRLHDQFLLLTVDCGISNHLEVDEIKQMGGTVIITDHHSIPSDRIPDCLVVNPSQHQCGFRQQKLAGVGVAFYLAAAIRGELAALTKSGELIDGRRFPQQPVMKRFLPFVALGTLADMVEMTVANRILVRAGMEAMAETSYPGVLELLSSTDIVGKDITSEDVGFQLAPLLNAAGRLGESQLSVALLTATERKKGKELAEKLHQLNIERKRICAENLETVLEKTSRSRIEEQNCIVAADDLHLGVAGIVASRLVEEFRLPAVVLSRIEKADGSVQYTGSARSVMGIDIVAALERCRKYLIRFGGHAMAAGLSVSEENLNQFRDIFSKEIKEQARSNMKLPLCREAEIPCQVDILMSDDYLACLRLFEPFGPGNPQPIFCDDQARVVDARAIGRDAAHLQLTLRGKFANLKGIGFYFGKRTAEVQQSPQRRLLYTPTINRYRGTVSWQVRVIDL